MPISQLINGESRDKEPLCKFIEIFKHPSLQCPDSVPLSMLQQTCQYNFLIEIESKIRTTKAYHQGKKLVEKQRLQRDYLYEFLELHSDASTYINDGSEIDDKDYYKEYCDATHFVEGVSRKD